MIQKTNGLRFGGYLILFSFVVLVNSCRDKYQFQLKRPSDTQVFFENTITDNDTFNILTFEYIYNGGGVALADFDNDGLSDMFFTGNMVANALYLNKGRLTFDEVAAQAGVQADGIWCSGVAVVDINTDGLNDLYVCATVSSDSLARKNLLFVNQGVQNGIPVFKEMAEAYGIADKSHTTMAAFLDYDGDGDLDLYLAVNKMDSERIPNVYKTNHTKASERVDKLYRNEWSESKGHPVFEEVSEEAGIIFEGYSLGVNVSDINLDGWSDIYVTNDYLTQDLIYINNQDGTFTNKAKEYLSHTSYSAMGNDVVDMNNDGLPDIIAVDMLPEDNYRKKTMMMGNNYNSYLNNERYGYQYQFVRNTFQLNQGINPETMEPTFGDVAFMAGVSSTDWSWAPLVADFDNDGYRDMIITNGFPKDVTDRDFSDYSVEVGRFASKALLLTKIPSVKIKNYAYKSIDGLRFENVTDQWGVRKASFSNGAAYADLDNDGDLDYVVNNINDPAFIYENKSENVAKKNAWVKIILQGSSKDPLGIGTKITVYAAGKTSYWDHHLQRGYLSSVDPTIVLGLGGAKEIDSIRVVWPSAKEELLVGLGVNTTLTLSEQDAQTIKKPEKLNGSSTLLTKVSKGRLDAPVHKEDDYIDFNIQPMLPHKLSQYGPGMAVSDVNADGLDDVYVSGALFEPGVFLIQNEDGSFRQEHLIQGDTNQGEELGVLFFDADGDGDRDLYLVNGSYEYPAGDSVYQDRFYENREGSFFYQAEALPDFISSGSCVRAADFDQDGDLDLFVGGRQVPHKYPQAASSYLLVNAPEKGEVRFVLKEEYTRLFEDYGMITDALWTDFDGDLDVDLVVVGEWMSPRFIQNNEGSLTDVTKNSGVADKVGWWNSLTAGDYDNDGDIDYLAGNLGLNTLNQAGTETPLGVYAADFDNNGGWDLVPSIYLKNPQGILKEYPYFGRTDMIRQMTRIKDKYPFYSDFARSSLEEMFAPGELDSALSYKASFMSSAYLENQGNGKFNIKTLPLAVQTAPIYGMLTSDFDRDGNLDVLAVGNDFGMEVTQGRLDAFKGLLLRGDGNGGFSPLTVDKTGFYVPGDAKSTVKLYSQDNTPLFLVGQNRAALLGFSQASGDVRVIDLKDDDVFVEYFISGQKKIIEAYYGHTFLSQSTRKIDIPAGATNIRVISFTGNIRAL